MLGNSARASEGTITFRACRGSGTAVRGYSHRLQSCRDLCTAQGAGATRPPGEGTSPRACSSSFGNGPLPVGHSCAAARVPPAARAAGWLGGALGAPRGGRGCASPGEPRAPSAAAAGLRPRRGPVSPTGSSDYRCTHRCAAASSPGCSSQPRGAVGRGSESSRWPERGPRADASPLGPAPSSRPAGSAPLRHKRPRWTEPSRAGGAGRHVYWPQTNPVGRQRFAPQRCGRSCWQTAAGRQCSARSTRREAKACWALDPLRGEHPSSCRASRQGRGGAAEQVKDEGRRHEPRRMLQE
eukprot:scaffold1897_cov129-Isochrysis_galbana.AAC.4